MATSVETSDVASTFPESLASNDTQFEGLAIGSEEDLADALQRFRLEMPSSAVELGEGSSRQHPNILYHKDHRSPPVGRSFFLTADREPERADEIFYVRTPIFCRHVHEEREAQELNLVHL